MNAQFSRGPTTGQIWIHALALVSGFTALAGLIGTSIQPSLRWRALVVIGLAAAVVLLSINTYDVICLGKALRTETDTRLRPMWRIAINVFAFILSVAGALTVPAPDQGFEWAATAAICLMIAGGSHGILLVWAVVDSVHGRRRNRRSGGNAPLSLEPLGNDDPIARGP